MLQQEVQEQYAGRGSFSAWVRMHASVHSASVTHQCRVCTAHMQVRPLPDDWSHLY